MAFTLNLSGELARAQKDYDTAQRYYEDSLFLAREMGARQREAVVLNNLSFVAYHRQDYQLALELVHQVLTIARETQSEFRQACFMATASGPAAALGHPDLAARLLGASYARFDALGIVHAPVDQGELDHFEAEARRQLGDEAYLQVWQAGQALTLQEAVSLALAKLDLGK
jgi:hypothetical protein